MNSTTETVLGCLFGLLFVALWVTPVPLGLRAAKRNHRSPHWMWFGLHPITGWIAFLVLRTLPPMKECSECGENTKAHARVCPYCLTPFPTMGGSGTESIAPQACDIQALTNKHEKALENAILIGRIIVVVLCFLSVGLYAFVYTIAVLKGNPWGFAAGFREARFDQPSVIVLVSLSALTFIGVLLGLGRFLARSSLKATSAVMAFSIAMLLASASLETIAIYGLVLGFMFGPGVSTLSLLLFMTTIVGGILIFPRVDRCKPAFDKGLQAILGNQPSPPGT